MFLQYSQEAKANMQLFGEGNRHTSIIFLNLGIDPIKQTKKDQNPQTLIHSQIQSSRTDGNEW